MTVRRYDSVREAEAVIRAAEGRGTMSQSYVVLRSVERSFWRCELARMNPLALIRDWFSPRFRVYAVTDRGRPLLVVPLERDGDGWRLVRGEYVELDYTDILYGIVPKTTYCAAFAAVVERMRADGVRRLVADYLDESSPTAEMLLAAGASVCAEFENYAVELKTDTFDGYLSSLRGNARRNLRKDLRRAGAAEIEFEFCSDCGYGSRIGRKLLSECRRIYRRRQAGRYGHRGPVASWYFKVLNYISISVPGDNGFLAVLRIGGRVAASMEGYVNRTRRALEVPRISMNGEFAEYGPGRLLVAECVRWMLSGAEFRILDLCRGDERYKKEVGGSRYLTRRMVLDLEGGR